MTNKSNASSDAQQIRVIQAQLYSLGYDLGNANFLDNSIGGENSNTRNAIIMYKDEYGISPVNEELTQEFLDSLNESAPLPNTESLN